MSKNMILNVPYYEIPFYEDTSVDKKSCLTVAGKIALKYILDKNFSLQYLNDQIKRKEGFRSQTCQIVPLLDEKGIRVMYYSDESLKPMLGGEEFMRDTYGAVAEHYLKYMDVEVMKEFVQKTLDRNLYEQKKLTLAELEDHVLRGHVPIMLVDGSVLYKVKKKPYNGHFVVMTGFDEKNVYFHDAAVRNRKVTKERFMDARNADGTDNDVVIVFGKK